MKRSEINAIMLDGEAFIRSRGFLLPPFAYWSPTEWAAKGQEVREIVGTSLGWDITDFGLGDYARAGLLLFTLRNGYPDGKGKPYAEKVMVANVDQGTPLHFHWRKMEDIINRGGGRLIFSLYNAAEDGEVQGTPVVVSVDGVPCTVPAGDTIVLDPGESITLPPRCYHRFWAEGERVLAGEISTVNDDAVDNRFYEPIGRFPTIKEDEEPLHLLCQDYGRYWQAGNP